MIWEVSCGAVVFCRAEGVIRYALVREADGRYSLPKGHMEPGETPRQTALREVLEETGLAVRLIDGFCEEESYAMREKPGVGKRVTYYLAQADHAQLLPRERDVTKAAWYALEDATALLGHESVRRVLLRADEYIRRKCDE